MSVRRSISTFAPGRMGDLHDAPFLGRRGVVPVDVVAADDVEDDIDAGAAGRGLYPLDEILGPVVDREVGAELLAGPAFRRRCRR